MTAALSNPCTTPLHGGLTHKTTPAQHYRTRCMKCENTGRVLAWFLIWQSPRLGEPPQKHSRPMDSEGAGAIALHELLDHAEAAPGTIFDVDLVSGMAECLCRKSVVDSTARQPKPTAPATVGTIAIQHGPTHKQRPVIDRKTAATGEREE